VIVNDYGVNSQEKSVSRKILLQQDNSAFGVEEQSLLKKLFKNYNKYQKPHGTIDLEFGLQLLSLINVKPKEQILELNTMLYQTWRDKRLVWSNVLNK
jgi:hypothetical protein